MISEERIDYVNDNLSLIQKTDGLTFGTDALLLAGYIGRGYENAAELGSGSGIISLLLLTRSKAKIIDCYEVQESYAELTRRNAELNSLSNRLISKCADIRDYSGGEKYSLVFTNPPYMKVSSGAQNDVSAKGIARHEIMGTIDDFLKATRGMLKYGGNFFAVYRPDRLEDLLFSMRISDIEPKRMTFVHADLCSESSMVLIEGKKGGKSGLYLTPPLIIYTDDTHKKYSHDMDYIMENGSFPERFMKRGHGKNGK